MKQLYRRRETLVKVKTNNLEEEKRYEFGALHHHASIKNNSFEYDCI